MAIGPIGSIIYVNQQTPFAASIRGDHLARFEIQNIMAQHILNEEEKKIQEVREPEETHQVDPDREHQRQEFEEELETQKEAAKKRKNEKEDDEPSIPLHKLDIKV